MNKINKKLLFAVFGFFVISSIVAILLFTNRPVDKITQIERYLSNTYGENEKIEIFDIQNKYGYELNAFTANGEEDRIGFAVLKVAENSNYELFQATPFKKLGRRGHDIYINHSSLINEKQESVQFLVVLSSNPDLAEIKYTLGDKITETIKVNSNPSMTWIEYPRNHSSGSYLFYDHEGNVIE